MNTSEKTITKEKGNGRIYTPPFIVNSVLDLSGYTENSILKKNVIDNSCGDGAFLCEIVRRYCAEAVSKESAEELALDLATYIHGIEIDEEACRKCIRNVSEIAGKFGIRNVRWDILCGDALSVKKYDGKMDFVLGNPPYVRVHNLGDSFDNIKKFSFSQNGMTDLFIVFYEIGIKMLNKNGVLGYITPSSYFNSLAGSYMRQVLVSKNLLDKIVDLKHFQAFNATTYTAITILRNNRTDYSTGYYRFDSENLSPYFVAQLTPPDFYMQGNYYFASKEDLSLLRDIYSNVGECNIQVKNGYATLCDSVFVHDFDFESTHIIPVIKSSKGIYKKILYPYDKNAKLIPEEELKKDVPIYDYLRKHKNALTKRSNENDPKKYWYAFGRSQALQDTYREKLSINALIRNMDDLKFVTAHSGTGVYGGLYIVSEDVEAEDIIHAMKSDEFITYVSLLGKYKSGGYYTYSSKDVKTFLNYKFAYMRGLF